MSNTHDLIIFSQVSIFKNYKNLGNIYKKNRFAEVFKNGYRSKNNFVESTKYN